MIKDKRLAIYVSSYDGCSDLWDTFFSMIDCFWPNCIFPIYLINNTYSYIHKNVHVINTGAEKNWFYRAISSLRIIDEEYVLFMLEDYFISKKVENDTICEIMRFIERNNVYYYQLSTGNTNSKEDIRTAVSAKTSYPVSLQPAIWKREKLLSILIQINGETPWDVENYFICKYKNEDGLIPGVFHDTRDILGYKNGVLRGKWIRTTLNYYKKKGITINTGNREVMSNMKMMKYRIAGFVHKNAPKTIKIICKKIISVLNFDYLK